MLVTSDFRTVFDHFIIDELVLLIVPALKYFLDHVVSIDIEAHGNHFVLKLGFDHLEMVLVFHDFDNLLYGAGSMRVLADAEGVFLYVLDDLGQLFFGANFRHLLDEIVAKAVVH